MEIGSFSPVTERNRDEVHSIAITKNNGQVYLSAAAMRAMGMPNSIRLFSDREQNRLLIVNADDISRERAGGAAAIDVTKRNDNDGGRCSGFPILIKNLLPEARVVAIEVTPTNGLVFPLLPENVED